MKYVAFLFYLLATSVFASIPVGHWQCNAYDAQNRSYQAVAKTQKKAMNQAAALCKRHTHQRRCRVAQSFCQEGPLTGLDNRCLVVDTFGRSWNIIGPDACDKAMSMCMEWQFLHGKPTQCSIRHR